MNNQIRFEFHWICCFSQPMDKTKSLQILEELHITDFAKFDKM